MLAVKRLAGVAPEVDLGECTLHFASAKQVNKAAEPTLALKPIGDVTRNSKEEYQWPQNRTHVSAKNLNLFLHQLVIDLWCYHLPFLNYRPFCSGWTFFESSKCFCPKSTISNLQLLHQEVISLLQ